MNDSDLKTTESQTGVEYKHRPAPTTVRLGTVSSADPIILDEVNGYPVQHLYVRCQDVRDRGLPLDADPRKPDESPQVTEMIRTLSNEPSEFVKRNNGIVLLCNSVEIDGATAELQFNKNEGICNGGHTYFSMFLLDELDEQATVHIEAIILGEENFETPNDRRTKIIEIARARNNNNQLERRSEANFLGYFDDYKNALIDDKLISWNEGDRRAYNNELDSVDFIRLIKSLDVRDFRHPLYNENAKTHKRLATSRGSILSKWAKRVKDANGEERERRPLYYLVPLSNDVLYIRDLVSHNLKNNTWGVEIKNSNFYQEYLSGNDRELFLGEYNERVGFDLPRTLEVLFTGLFRSNLYLSMNPDHGPNLVGWFIDLSKLWDGEAFKIVNEMSDMFSNVDSDPKQFIRLNGPFNLDFFKMMVGQSVPAPDQIYDIDKVSRGDTQYGAFIKTGSEESTHWLRTYEDTSKDDELISVNEETPPDASSMYKETRVADLYNYTSPESE